MSDEVSRNWGFDLARATEAAARRAGRWMGVGKRDEADVDATEAMYQALKALDFDGHIVIGEEGKLGVHSPLEGGRTVGSGNGPAMDIVLDAIDGRSLLAQGRAGAIAVAAVAPRGAMWAAAPAVYMNKLVVDREAARSTVAECMDAPAAWTLALAVAGATPRVSSTLVADRP